MKDNDDFVKLIRRAVKLAIEEGLCVDDFQYAVREAIRKAIVEGHMFIDYLQHRHEIEYQDEMEYEDDQWEDYIISAMGDDKDEYLEYIYDVLNDGIINKLGIEPTESDLEFVETVKIQVAEAIEKGLLSDVR